MGELTPPEPLAPTHDVDSFECGRDSLNSWLKNRAAENAKRGVTKTFVVSDEGRVVGYYSLAAGAVDRKSAGKALGGDMPQAIPVIILARLGVDKSYSGRGIAAGLVKDAILRSAGVAGEIGVRGILVDALDDDALRFWTHFGFRPSGLEPMTLMISMRDALAAVER